MFYFSKAGSIVKNILNVIPDTISSIGNFLLKRSLSSFIYSAKGYVWAVFLCAFLISVGKTISMTMSKEPINLSNCNINCINNNSVENPSNFKLVKSKTFDQEEADINTEEESSVNIQRLKEITDEKKFSHHR